MPSLEHHSGLLGKTFAGHLLRRSCYMISPTRIATFAQYTADQAVDILLDTPPSFSLPEPIHHVTEQHFINLGTRTNLPEAEANGTRRILIKNWWMNEALQDVTAASKMSFFLHTCFTTADEGLDQKYFDHVALLQFYALGSFKALAEKMCVDHTMLTYLDNAQNDKNSPNENFAREFLELFTIGKGNQAAPGDYTNYTEADIQEAAKLLTGFKTTAIDDRNNPLYLDPDTNLFRGRPVYSRHDTADKTFSHRFNNKTITGAVSAEDMWRELHEFVEMIFAQTATAQYLVRRLYLHFVGKQITPAIEQAIITPLAQDLKAANYEIKPVLKSLLKSKHFFGQDTAVELNTVVGAMLRSPWELWCHSMNMFEVGLPDPTTDAERHRTFYNGWVRNNFMIPCGMDLWKPSDVAGYPAYYQTPSFYREWFNSSTITTRYLLGQMLLTGKKVIVGGSINGAQLDIVPWFVKHFKDDPSNATWVVNEFVTYLLPLPIPQERFDYFLNEIFLDGLHALSWLYDNWTPFEASNFTEDAYVRTPLENLVKAIMYAPEYQLI